MDKRFKWPVNQKPNCTDSPYCRGAAGCGAQPYHKVYPKNFNRQHGHHTGNVRPNKYYKKPISPQNASWTSRRSGGAMAPPSGGASNPSDVVTLIVDNNNLKRMVVLHVNLMQEQSKKLSAKDKELDEQNIKINTLYAQNQEMKLLNARLEASLEELRKELRVRKRTHHHEHGRRDQDDDDDDDDTSMMPPVKISRHMETQTNVALDTPQAKPEIATTQQAKVEQQHQPRPCQQPQPQQQSHVKERQVRPEVKEQVGPEIRPEVKEQVRPEVNEQVRPEVKEQVRPEVKEQVRPEVKEQVRPEVKEQVRPEVTDQIRTEVKEQVRPEVKEQIRPEVKEQATPEVKEQVRADAKEQEQQQQSQQQNQHRPHPITQDQQHSYHQHLPIPNVPKVLDTSVTSLSPTTPIDIRKKLGRGEFNGKKVSTMFLHRVNLDSSLTTSTTITNSNCIEPDPEIDHEKDHLKENQAAKVVQMKVQEADREHATSREADVVEHETSKEESFNHLEVHEMEIVSETILGAEEEVIGEVVEEMVINDETTLVEEIVGNMVGGDQLVDEQVMEDHMVVVEQQVVMEEQLVQEEEQVAVEDQLVQEEEQVVVEEHLVQEEQIVLEEQLVQEEQIVEEEQVVEEEQLVQEEQVVVEDQFVQEEQVVMEEQFIQEEQVVLDEQLVQEEQVVEEEQLVQDEEHLLQEEHAVVEQQLVEEEDHVIDNQLTEQKASVEKKLVKKPPTIENKNIQMTDANGHLDEDSTDEEHVKLNHIDAHSPHKPKKHQNFGLIAADAPSAHSTPNNQMKLHSHTEEDQQEKTIKENDQVETEISTVEYFSDDSNQEEVEIHTEKVIPAKTKQAVVDETKISIDNGIAPTPSPATNAQAPLSAPASASTPAPAPAPTASLNSTPKPVTAKKNSMAVIPTSQKAKMPLKTSLNHQTPRPQSPDAGQLTLNEKTLQLKLKQCVLPTQNKKSPKITEISNDNHDIQVEEKTLLKLHKHLEKQQRRQSQTPVLKKKSRDDIGTIGLIFPPTASVTPITPASTPVTTPSTTPVTTPTSSIESSAALDVELDMHMEMEMEMQMEMELEDQIKTDYKSDDKSLHIIDTPLTPQSMSSTSSSNSNSSTSNRKTPNNLQEIQHQSHGKTKSISTNTPRFLTASHLYTTRSWEDQDIHCDNEFFLEEADELLSDNPRLEIPKWRDNPIKPKPNNKDVEPLSDEDFVKRHEKLVKDEIERKRRDERFLREQIRSKELRMRHKQDEVVVPLEPLPISTFYPLPGDVESVQFVDEVPVQVFGENMIALDTEEFSLPWIDEENAVTDAEKANAHSIPVSTLASKKLPTTVAEQKHQELNSSYVFIKRRKRRKAGKSAIFGST